MSSGKGTDLGNFVKASGGKATIFAKMVLRTMQLRVSSLFNTVVVMPDKAVAYKPYLCILALWLTKSSLPSTLLHCFLSFDSRRCMRI